MRAWIFPVILLLAPLLLNTFYLEEISAATSPNGQWLCVQGSGAPAQFGDYYSASDGGDTYYSFYIEVPPGTSVLDIDIFDPDVGLGGSAEVPLNRDRQRGGSWDTSTKYTLYDPSGTEVTSAIGDSTGPSGSDGTWWDFYDVSNPASGIWELRVDSSSSVTTGDDINYFGLRANGLNIYAYRISVGTNPSLSRKYDLYLYIHLGCQFSIREWDWDSDADGSQGFIRVTSPSGSFSIEYDDLDLSPNAAWNSHTISGWTYDKRSDDYGLWHLEVNITYYSTGGNYGVVEAYDFAGNPIKIYLPSDAGGPPSKPILSKECTVIMGPDPPRAGSTSTVEVRLKVVNPTSMTLNSVSIVDYVSSDVTWEDILTTTQGTASYDPGTGRIDWNVGSLTPSSLAEMSYRVSVTPSSSGEQFSINLLPGPQGTKATYVSPVTGVSETIGPICNLKLSSSPAEIKQLYLRDGYSLRTSKGSSLLSESIPNSESRSWVQTPAFAADLSVDGEIRVLLYIIPHPSSFILVFYPDVRVTLSYDGNSYTDTIYNIESAGWYTFTFSGITSIPQGDSITLTVEVLPDGFFIWRPWVEVYYNSQTYDSRIEIPTSSYVEVEWVKTYDVSNIEKSTFAAGETVIVRSKVNDPLGSGDIAGAWITIYFPNNTKSVDNQPMGVETVDPNTPSLYKVFRYDYSIPTTAPSGTYLIVVTANETNGVFSSHSTTITVVAGGVMFEPDQLFSAAAGSNTSYNVYLFNTGGASDIFDLTESANQTVGVDIWLEIDWLGSGDVHIAYDANGDGVWEAIYSDANSNGKPDVSVGSNSNITLIVTVILPSTSSGSVQVNLTATGSSTSVQDFVLISTKVDNSLPWPSNWFQLGSDPVHEVSPACVDDKAMYATYNDTCIFFRLAEASQPNPSLYLYEVLLDTKTGGVNIGGIGYDYKLSSDGRLYEWDGTSWVVLSDTYVQVSGTSIVLWANISDIQVEYQDVYILARTYEGTALRDEKGPYMISRTLISEMPLFLLPILAVLLLLFINRKRHAS